jgi:8-oxo-dGTP pyrophosphatase MutT (NUDIX family)
MFRPKHHVSAKVALYSHDLGSVLVMYYPKRGTNGLPGGHVESKENPDDTIRRELIEELTLTVDTMKRTDFFLHKGNTGRVILAYTAIAPSEVSITPTDPKFEYAKWVTKNEFEAITMAPGYTRFVLENWPNTQA